MNYLLYYSLIKLIAMKKQLLDLHKLIKTTIEFFTTNVPKDSMLVTISVIVQNMAFHGDEPNHKVHRKGLELIREFAEYSSQNHIYQWIACEVETIQAFEHIRDSEDQILQTDIKGIYNPDSQYID